MSEPGTGGDAASARGALRFIFDRSFGLGASNAHGLQLRPAPGGRGFIATYEPKPEHRGWPDLVHGGIASALLDELMARAAADEAGEVLVTVELCVRYRRPFRADGPATVEGWATGDEGRGVRTEGAIVDVSGAVVATATGIYRHLPGDAKAAFHGPGGGPAHP